MKRFVCAMSVVFAAMPVVAGPIHHEVAAGNTLGTAENVNVAVTHIKGDLHGGNFRGDAGPDFEDIYLIYIANPGTEGCDTGFSASTVWNTPSPGSDNTFDTQLWLFDASGVGLLGNDDVAAGESRSFITFPSTDSSAVAFPGQGFYYLAISGGDLVPGGGGGDDPTSAGGSIFDFFDAAGGFQISGPDGAGGGALFSGWSATGSGDVGSYDIQLSCVIPEPSAAALLTGAAFILGARRRRRIR